MQRFCRNGGLCNKNHRLCFLNKRRYSKCKQEHLSKIYVDLAAPHATACNCCAKDSRGSHKTTFNH